MELFDSFPKVTSWLTLTAFTVAVVGSLVSRYLYRDVRLISKAPPNRRAELIDKFLDRHGLDARDLTKEQKFELIYATIKQRRLPWIVMTVGGILITIILLSFIVSQSLRDSPNGKGDRDDKVFVRPAKKDEMLILVANFDGPEPENYRFTDVIVSNLKSGLDSANVRVEVLPTTLNLENGGSARAKAEGEKLNAAVVVWGWYGLTSMSVPISVNFEILKSPYNLIEPGLCPSVKGDLRKASTKDLQSIKLQAQLSSELAYLILIAKGYASYVADDCPHAIEYLERALSKDSRDRSFDYLAFFARGECRRTEGKTFLAVFDYSRSIAHYPTSEAYSQLGETYDWVGNLPMAADSYRHAIKLAPHDAELVTRLGVIYERLGDLTAALSSYRAAISIDENTTLKAGLNDYIGYLAANMGADTVAGQWTVKVATLLRAINIALAKAPEHPLARFERAMLTEKTDFSASLRDYEHLLRSPQLRILS